MEEILNNIYQMTAFSDIIAANGTYLVMYLLAFVLLYLGIVKHFEPLLLIPIAFGVLIANFPGGDMGVYQADEAGRIINAEGKVLAENIWEMSLPQIAHDLGLMNFLYYMLIKTGFLPPVIFMGVGALTDFGPMLRNLRLSIFGAAAQMGIFAVLIIAVASGQFNIKEAASLGIIGGADGPTAIFTTIKLAPHLLAPIAIAAYSYMALVPVIIPLVVKMLCSEKELKINMKEQDKLFPINPQLLSGSLSQPLVELGIQARRTKALDFSRVPEGIPKHLISKCTVGEHQVCHTRIPFRALHIKPLQNILGVFLNLLEWDTAVPSLKIELVFAFIDIRFFPAIVNPDRSCRQMVVGTKGVFPDRADRSRKLRHVPLIQPIQFSFSSVYEFLCDRFGIVAIAFPKIIVEYDLVWIHRKNPEEPERHSLTPGLEKTQFLPKRLWDCVS